MRLARPREQQGSGVSDYVVSHGCDCLETHGWVQLPAIAEAVCVCVWLTMSGTWEMELVLPCYLPSPLPAYDVGEALRLLLLRGRAPAHL